MPKSVKRHWINYQIPRYLMSLGDIANVIFAFKEQIRNKTVFFYNSVFFSFHLISFFALGNI